MTKSTKNKSRKRRKKKAASLRASDGRVALSQRLAPDDLVPGLDVAILESIDEFVVPTAVCGTLECARIETFPCGTEALLVLDVCLPFVLVRGAEAAFLLDVRQCRLARLDKRFARRVRKSVKAS
ncbi:MAG: hypothetical protein ACYTF9_16345 [Planctomycetota bacterium]